MKFPTIEVTLRECDGVVKLASARPLTERRDGPAHGVVVQQTVRYEPAVPKCATCPVYESRTDNSPPFNGLCYRNGRLNGGEVVPGDGSGYCHRHPEARR